MDPHPVIWVDGLSLEEQECISEFRAQHGEPIDPAFVTPDEVTHLMDVARLEKDLRSDPERMEGSPAMLGTLLVGGLILLLGFCAWQSPLLFVLAVIFLVGLIGLLYIGARRSSNQEHKQPHRQPHRNY